MEFQKISQSKRRQNKRKRNKEQMRKIKDKQQDDRLKPNHINNYIKYKFSKHPYKKAALVKLDNWTISKKVRLNYILTFQVALVVKNLPENAGDITDMGSIAGWGRSPGGGHGNPLLPEEYQRGVWQATIHRTAKSQT